MLRWMSLLMIVLLLAAPATAEVRLALIIAQKDYDDRFSLPPIGAGPDVRPERWRTVDYAKRRRAPPRPTSSGCRGRGHVEVS